MSLFKFFKTSGGLYIAEEPNKPKPKQKVEKDKRYSERLFTCHYGSDVDRFEKLVKSKGGYFCGYMKTPFLNVYNEHNGMEQYCCIYQYYEDIGMEILC